MIHFLLAGENLPFTIALALMLGIGTLEMVFSLFGPGLSHLIEAGMPDLDHDYHVDATGIEEVTPLSRLLTWLRLGQVPLLMLFVIFLTGFGLAGLAIQFASWSLLNLLQPAWLVSVAAFFAAVPCVRVGGGWLGRLMPKDETTAVSEETFVGRIAIITSGTARRGLPAEARLQDQYKQSHYILIEPDEENETFAAGTAVLVVKREGNIFRAIINPNSALVD